MKILSLEFENLNSLSGIHRIDFSKPEFNGVFSISGPTGSGKTTILDAICIALYGKTPRGEDFKFSKKELKDGIITKGKSKGFSKLTFENNNDEYVVRFDIKRTKSDKSKDSDAKVWKNGTVIADNVTKRDKCIEEILGMSFEQFSKTIVLPQGKFQDFLVATTDKKIEILNELFDTDIYTRISNKAYELCYEKGCDIDSKSFELDNLKEHVLSDEDEKALKERLSEINRDVKNIQESCKSFSEQIDFIKIKEEKEKQLSDINKKLPVCEVNLKSYEESLKSLEKELNDLKYDEISSHINELFKKESEIGSLEKDISELSKKISKSEKQKDEKESELKKYSDKIKINTTKYEDVEKQLDISKVDEELISDIRAIKSMDSNIKSQRVGKEKLEKTLEKLNKDIPKLESDIKKSEKDLNRLYDELKKLRDERTIKVGDKTLDSIFETEKGLRNRIKELESIRSLINDIAQYKKDQESLEKNLDNMEVDKGLIEKEISALNPKIENIKNEIEELEIASRKISEVLNYEEARKTLKDGEECPLCGSKHHPFIEKNPILESVDDKITLKKNELKKLERDSKEFDKRFAHIEGRIKSENEQIEKIKKSYADKNKEFLKKCKNSDISIDIDSDGIKQIISQLEEDIKKSESDYKYISKIDKEINSKDSDSKIISGNISNLKDQLKNKISQLEEVKSDIESSNTKLIESEQEFYKIVNKYGCSGSSCIPTLEKRYEKRLKIKKEYEFLKSEKIELENNYKLISNNIKELEDRIFENQISYKEKTSKSDNLNNDIKSLQEQIPYKGNAEKCRKSLNDMKNNIEKEIHEADKKITSCKQTIEILEKDKIDCERVIQEQISKIDLNKTYDECEQSLKALRDRECELIKEQGSLEEKQENNNKNKKKVDSLTKEIDKLKKEYRPWEMLNNLIGQKNGMKFQREVQQITLNILLHKANEYLKRMCPRYELILKANADENSNNSDKDSDKLSNMSIYVRDNELISVDGKSNRHVGSLSGGEKFIVSLALALGLSNMQNRKFSIGTMFIDEGFATLDSDSLETVIGVLQNLSKNNISIGVISHVDALKEGISTSIEIEKGALGHSKIKGPGVTLLDKDPDEKTPSKRSKKK